MKVEIGDSVTYLHNGLRPRRGVVVAINDGSYVVTVDLQSFTVKPNQIMCNNGKGL